MVLEGLHMIPAPARMLVKPGPEHVEALVKGLCAEILDMDLAALAAREMAEERLTEALLALRAGVLPTVPARPLALNHREGRA